VLSDRYRIEREIGRGGMATVYLASDLKHGREVAIKVLHPELASSGGGDRFLREIAIAARLKHPHILSLIDSGEAGGFYYFVMPYVEGESLRDRLEREKQLPIEDAIEIAREVTDGIGYAHRQGVVHRDIKPANIMLSEGHALIADFGVARAMEEEGQGLTRTGMAVGTPQYMSPEQASGTEDVDGRTDLYALGCVLYEMLAGEPPLTGPTPQATAGLRLTETATALPVLRDTVPGGLDRLTRKLLAKTPADRYPTAEKLAKSLRSPEVWASAKRQWSVGRHLIEAVVALALLAAGVWLTTWFAGGSGSAPVELDPELVAVLPFENVGGDPELDHLGAVAAGVIAVGLAETGYVDVAEQRTVAAEWDALAVTNSGANATGWIQGIGVRIGAGTLVPGAYYAQGDSVHFQASVIEASSGEVIAELGPYAAPRSAPNRAIEKLREQAMIHVVARLQLNLTYSDMPSSYAALLEGIQGREAYGTWTTREIEAVAAHFRRAAEIDTTWNYAIGMAALAHLNLLQFDSVDSLRAILETRKTVLRPGEGVLRLPFLTAFLAGSRAGILRAYRAYAELSGNYYLVAFGAQLNNRPHECLEAIEKTEVSINTWDTLPWCLHSLGRYEAELDTVRWALGGDNQDVLGLLIWREATALAALGPPEDALRAIDRARSISLAPEDRFFLEVGVGLELEAHGHPTHGQEQLNRAVAWYEARPPAETNTRQHRYYYARALSAAGRWAEARELFRALQREEVADVLHHNDDISLRGHVGVLSARLGDVQEAARIEEELRLLDRRFLWGNNTYWRAAIASVLGERDRATALLADALSAGLMWYRFASNLDYPKWDFHVDPDFESLRGYEPFEELIGPQD